MTVAHLSLSATDNIWDLEHGTYKTILADIRFDSWKPQRFHVAAGLNQKSRPSARNVNDMWSCLGHRLLFQCSDSRMVELFNPSDSRPLRHASQDRHDNGKNAVVLLLWCLLLVHAAWNCNSFLRYIIRAQPQTQHTPKTKLHRKVQVYFE